MPPSDGEAPEVDAGGSAPIDPAVETVLQQIRSGVRQRAAEAATVGSLGSPGSLGSSGSETARQSLLALRQREFVAEPVPFSHRARGGRVIVFVRKAFFHLFLKWLVRPVLEQQNGFNQAASRLLQDLLEAVERGERERRELGRRIAELEGRPGSTESSATDR